MTSRLFTTLIFFAIISQSAISAFCNSTCQQDLEQLYIQGIQARILEGLHLRAPLKNITIPKLSEEQIEELMGVKEEELEKKRVFVLSKPCDNDIEGCVSFPMTQTTLSSIYQANLRFFVDISLFPRIPKYSSVPIKAVIRRVYADGTQEAIRIHDLLADTSKKWEVPIEAEEVKAWAEDGVIGLTITAEYESNAFLVDGAVKPDSENPAMRPTLILDMEPERRRDRRHAEAYCPPESVDKSCCLHDMMVDFAELGWHFIMAPKKYNAFMCRGDCRVNSYAGIRFGHSKLMKDAQLEGALHCCHPSGYESLKVIYTRADNEILVTSIPGMIARSCACA